MSSMNEYDWHDLREFVEEEKEKIEERGAYIYRDEQGAFASGRKQTFEAVLDKMQELEHEKEGME